MLAEIALSVIKSGEARHEQNSRQARAQQINQRAEAAVQRGRGREKLSRAMQWRLAGVILRQLGFGLVKRRRVRLARARIEPIIGDEYS